jgi:hypothetical protein
MKIIIEHSNTKREINGPFQLCINKSDLAALKQALNEVSEDDWVYGWIGINEECEHDRGPYSYIRQQRSIPNTPPKTWD